MSSPYLNLVDDWTPLLTMVGRAPFSVIHQKNSVLNPQETQFEKNVVGQTSPQKPRRCSESRQPDMDFLSVQETLTYYH